MKRIFTAMFAILAIGLATYGATAHAATSNEFVSGNSIYTVAGVEMVTVGSGNFMLTYDNGNSATFPDPTGAQFTAIRQGAPAFKTLVQVGTSGVYINTDSAKQINCQVGTATPGVATTYGDHIFVVWNKVGYALIDDAGCATYTSIKAGAN